MKIIVDTSIWSSALRRGVQNNSAAVQELRHLVQDHRVQMIGPVRQEILSGIRHESQFNVAAATFFNLCRTKGVQGSNTDFLICAVAVRNKFAIYSTDKDFDLFSKHIPIIMYRPEKPHPFHNA
jgi:predicted nucleic acid-binding protein